MRNLKLVIGSSALAGVANAVTPVATAVSSECKGTAMDTDWYFDLITCGLDAGSVTATRSGLLSCVGGLTAPAESTTLATLLGSTIDPCMTCAVTFANAVRSLRIDSGFEAACVSDSAWLNPQSETDVVSIDCLNVLYEPISAFNVCTGNGYDLVTADPTTRCSTDEFVTFEMDFRPWSSIVYEALVDTTTVGRYAGLIGADFKLALDALDCQTCFDDMFTSLAAMSPSDQSKCIPDPLATSCLSATAEIRATFELCTGGHAINTDVDIRCDVQEAVLFDEVYRPYMAYVLCANEALGAPFTACVDVLNGIEQSPASICDPCYNGLKASIETDWISICNSYPFSLTCTNTLNAKDGPLRDFAVCTGFEMNFAPTQCTPDELTALTTNDLSYAPMLINAKYASDQFSAGNMIETNMTALNLAITGITCNNCFRAFVGDAYEHINNSTNTMNCTNPYTTDCATSISDITARFTTCSGALLTNSSANLCSSAEYSAIVAAGLPREMLALALSADTAANMLSGLNTLITDSALAVPCELCFSELLRSVVALSADDKLACADINSDACTAVLAVPLATFDACSGSEFVATTITTTTAPTTTAAPVTTTTVAPTTKSSRITAAGVLFVSSVLLICL